MASINPKQRTNRRIDSIKVDRTGLDDVGIAHEENQQKSEVDEVEEKIQQNIPLVVDLSGSYQVEGDGISDLLNETLNIEKMNPENIKRAPN